MSLRSRIFQVAALSAVLVPSTTFADSLGAIGVVDSVTVYESSSDDYNMQNGVLTVREKTGTKRNYKWGGSFCPSRTVSAASISLLFEAMRSNTTVEIVPSYKVGNGSERCLTGFKLDAIDPQASVQM